MSISYGCPNEDGLSFNSESKSRKQDYFNKLLLWSCNDECLYQCMWRTTKSFMARKWEVPQFFGKVIVFYLWEYYDLFESKSSNLLNLMNFSLFASGHLCGCWECRSQHRWFFPSWICSSTGKWFGNFVGMFDQTARCITFGIYFAWFVYLLESILSHSIDTRFLTIGKLLFYL